MITSHHKTIKLWEWYPRWLKEQMLRSLQVDSLLSNIKAHTCSENSATSMKSLWNWAEEVQGFDGGKRGTDNSSGIASWSSSPPPKPSVPVKASRSGDPIISTQWEGQPIELCPLWSTLRRADPTWRPGAARPPVCESAVRTNNLPQS